MRLALLGLLALPCSEDGRPAPAAPAPAPAPLAAAVDARRWLAGDLHMHVAPPDDPGDVQLSVAQIADRARAAKMDFVVLTPHIWPAVRATLKTRWRKLAEDARAITGVTLIPGIEWSTPDGHFTVTGADLSAVSGDDFLAVAHAGGAFVSVNHPFAVPTRIPGVRASHFDMSYRVWTKPGARGFTAIDGVEVWNFPLGLANLISRPGGRTGEDRAWTEANRVVHAEHRKVAAVGGTDNHKGNVMPTTWVLAADTSERAILDALRAGAVCVGGPEAGSLRARGDGDAAWHRVGDALIAPHQVTLSWDGIARLYIDDVDRGDHPGGFTHATDGALHTYRIVIANSRSGFIYANLGAP